MWCGQVISYVLFFFPAEEGIRDAQGSRGVGDVFKRQDQLHCRPAMTVSGLSKAHNVTEADVRYHLHELIEQGLVLIIPLLLQK